jgi:hypothetical protein
MNDSKELESLSALAEATEAGKRRQVIAWVRVSPGPYLAVASVSAFLAALLLRSEYDLFALLLIGVALFVIPILAFADRIVFDGVVIRRQSPIHFLLRALFGRHRQLSVSDFETVETNAVRTLRRRGRVRYRYRTQISGKGKDFIIASGGDAYRKLIRELLPLVHEDKLDNRSRDLRDYLADPEFVKRRTEMSQLASEDVLDEAKDDFRVGGKPLDRNDSREEATSPKDLERAHLLRRLGNELRVSGRLREAGEAFRRALNVTPEGLRFCAAASVAGECPG